MPAAKAGFSATLPPLLSASVRALKVASTPAERVVTTKLALTPPMFTVAVTLPPRVVLEVTLTATVCPLRMELPLNAAPSTISAPLLTLMLARTLMSLIVTVLLVTTVPGATPLRAVKAKLAGVVSAAATARLKVSAARSPAPVLPSASRTVSVYWADAAAVVGRPPMVPPCASPTPGARYDRPLGSVSPVAAPGPVSV